MKQLYACHTVYHLLITLLKHDASDTKTDLYLFDAIPGVDHLAQRIRETSLFDKVEVASESQRVFTELNTYRSIFIFNDWTYLGHFLRKHALAYHLLEDGYNYFTYTVYERGLSLKGKIFSYLFPASLPLGYSSWCRSIEVNDKSKVSSTDSRYSKMMEVPRKDLFARLSSDRKKQLLEIFGVQSIATASSQSVLILTQPLYQDKWDAQLVQTSQDQFAFYKQIVDQYADDYTVFMKVHPRDTVDYSSLQSVLFLDKHVPMELYEFVGEYFFDIGITHSSTALDFLSCVGEKITIKEMREKQ